MYKNLGIISIITSFYLSFGYSQGLPLPEMEPLGYQIGTWVAKDVKTDKEGRRLQFGYELQWFDQKKSIAKMIITSVYEDGEIMQFWEGFKKWDPQENIITYNGFCRDGRTATGYIEKVNDHTIHTIYSGNLPNGTKVYIEDIATQTDPKHFTSTTQLRMEGEKKWRVVNTDHWIRVEIQVFNENLN